MDFLGVGVPELVVILVLALIFVGPKELPQLAEKAGKFLRDLRMMSEGFTTEWRREIGTAARLEELQQVRQELTTTQQMLRDTNREIKSSTVFDVVTSTATPSDKPPAPSAAPPSETTPETPNGND